MWKNSALFISFIIQTNSPIIEVKQFKVCVFGGGGLIVK